METFVQFNRYREYISIRTWCERHYADTGTVYGRFRRYIRVSEINKAKIPRAMRYRESCADHGIFIRFFMGIGSVIRTDASPIAVEAFARAQRRPFIMAAQQAYRPRDN